MLSIVGCSTAPLASTHEVPVAPPPPVGITNNVCRRCCVSLGDTITWLRTTGLEVCEDRWPLNVVGEVSSRTHVGGGLGVEDLEVTGGKRAREASRILLSLPY